MMDAVSKLSEAQSQTERMMIDMEQRHIEFEQCQMERDAQERKEEQMFQLQVMQLMMAQRGQFLEVPSHTGYSMDSHHPHTFFNPQPVMINFFQNCTHINDNNCHVNTDLYCQL